jgi:hypothetical protein
MIGLGNAWKPKLPGFYGSKVPQALIQRADVAILMIANSAVAR